MTSHIDTYPRFADGLFDPEERAPIRKKKRVLTPEELEKIGNPQAKLEVIVPDKFKDQNPLTIAEIQEAAQVLWNNQIFSFFRSYNQRGPEKKVGVLSKALNTFVKRLKGYYEHKEVFFPFIDDTVRAICIELFTKKSELSSKSIYELLGMFDLYSLFHMFCTQTVPVGLHFDFAQENTGETPTVPSRSMRLFKFLSPQGISSTLRTFDRSFFSKEQKWISNDKETRIKIAHEMFSFIKEYLSSHPNEVVTIIEPGAGNGEFTGILAELIFQDSQTRGRVNLVLKEYSERMILEGRNKLERLQKKLTTPQGEPVDLRVHYICGSAEVPLQDQLNDIKSLVETQDNDSLQQKYKLTFEQAENLLKQTVGSKVVGAVSTYTFGAMGEYAVKIAQQTLADVVTEGRIIFADFADRPPEEYTQKEYTTQKKKQKRLRKLIKIFDTYAGLGFAEGLAINLGFWEHDVMQIWNVYHMILSLNNRPENTSSEVDLKAFALLPISANNSGVTVVALPGYFETIIRTQGLAGPETKVS
ncbi:MAG: hypothetical protein BroJett025_02860 [Patescibacteria group bacterium]|nr:MAG: hypothetical protein BroJett025_02860 [Patescibacteria group bacterium]